MASTSQKRKLDQASMQSDDSNKKLETTAPCTATMTANLPTSPLEDMPETVLPEHIMPFLRPIDHTSLCHSCRRIKTIVNKNIASNGGIHHVKEEVLKSKVGYETVGDSCLLVHQIQAFHFYFSKSQSEQVKVSFKLFNQVWLESDNSKVDDPEDRFPGETEMAVSVRDHRSHREELYFDSNEDRSLWGVDLYDVGKLRGCLRYVFLAAKSIASFDNKNMAYPSAEYLMRRLPQESHAHFPSDFDWTAPHEDRKTQVEVKYRPAPTLEIWREDIWAYWGCIDEFPCALSRFDDYCHRTMSNVHVDEESDCSYEYANENEHEHENCSQDSLNDDNVDEASDEHKYDYYD